jgi:hypothetical protein
LVAYATEVLKRARLPQTPQIKLPEQPAGMSDLSFIELAAPPKQAGPSPDLSTLPASSFPAGEATSPIPGIFRSLTQNPVAGQQGDGPQGPLGTLAQLLRAFSGKEIRAMSTAPNDLASVLQLLQGIQRGGSGGGGQDDKGWGWLRDVVRVATTVGPIIQQLTKDSGQAQKGLFDFLPQSPFNPNPFGGPFNPPPFIPFNPQILSLLQAGGGQANKGVFDDVLRGAETLGRLATTLAPLIQQLSKGGDGGGGGQGANKGLNDLLPLLPLILPLLQTGQQKGTAQDIASVASTIGVLVSLGF